MLYEALCSIFIELKKKFDLRKLEWNIVWTQKENGQDSMN